MDRQKFTELFKGQFIEMVDMNGKPIHEGDSVKFYKGEIVICKISTFYNISVLRAFGIPVTLDFTPDYSNRNGEHEWTAILHQNNPKSKHKSHQLFSFTVSV